MRDGAPGSILAVPERRKLLSRLGSATSDRLGLSSHPPRPASCRAPAPPHGFRSSAGKRCECHLVEEHVCQFQSLVAVGGVLYVPAGTSTATVDPISLSQSAGTVSSVYYNPINPVDGTLASAWTANPSSLIKAVEKNTIIGIGSYVLASGGLYNGASNGASEETYSTQSTTDSSLGSFNGATGSHTISGSSGGYNFFNHSATLYVDPAGSPHVLILGGPSLGLLPAVQPGVWYLK